MMSFYQEYFLSWMDFKSAKTSLYLTILQMFNTSILMSYVKYLQKNNRFYNSDIIDFILLCNSLQTQAKVDKLLTTPTPIPIPAFVQTKIITTTEPTPKTPYIFSIVSLFISLVSLLLLYLKSVKV